MIRIMAIGDAGEDSILRRQNTALFRRMGPIDAVLVLGDNFYDYGVKSETDARWEYDINRVLPRGIPCLAILGNHDYLGDPEAQVRKTYLPSSPTSVQWFMPKRYYMSTLDQQGVTVDLWMLDTFSLSPTESSMNSISMGMSSLQWSHLERVGQKDKVQQLEWLESSLKTSTAPWKIVCGHYPVFSDGGHGDNQELVDCLMPLFQKYGVDLYLCGHDHNLQHLSIGGVQFIVSGTGSRYHAYHPQRSTVPSKATGMTFLEFSATQALFGFVGSSGNVYSKSIKKSI